jgi:hypothetical protein
MRKPKQYTSVTSVTANLNTDGSPMIIAWKNNREFDLIPLSDGKGGEIKRVMPITPLTEAAPGLLAALQQIARIGGTSAESAIASAAIAKATQP